MNLKLRLAVCAAMIFACQTAHAGALGRLLTFDGGIHHDLTGPPVPGNPFVGGGEDELTDESRAKFVDVDGSLGFSAGDIIFGMIIISDVDSSGVGSENIGEDEQIAIVFSAKIAGTAGTVYSPGDIISFEAVADATDSHDLRKLLDGHISGPAGIDDDSIFVVVETDTGTDDGGLNPLNFDKPTAEEEIKEFNASNDWSWVMTGGLVEDDDFFDFDFSPSGPTVGTETGGFTVQSDNLPGAVYLPVDVQNFTGDITTHDITLSFGTIFTTGDSPWDFENKATFVVNAVPEPGSLAIWAGVFLVGGMARRKKNRVS